MIVLIDDEDDDDDYCDYLVRVTSFRNEHVLV